MNGTIFSVTLAIDLMPPTITRKTTAAITKPVTTPGKSPTMLTICACAWLAWNMLPPPSAPPMQNTEKTTAMIRPPGTPRSRKPLVM